MSCNPCMVINFSRAKAEQKQRAADAKPHITIADALRRIQKCDAWLQAHELTVTGFGFSTLSLPVVYVDATRHAWSLFAGRARSLGHFTRGALRCEAWEGFDEHNHVNVRWEEVSAWA